jgi:hypothetical protein
MTIIEVVFVVSSIFNLLSIFLVFAVFANLIRIKTLVEQTHVGVGNVLGRVLGVEQSVSKISQGFTEFIQMTEGMVDRLDDDGKFNQIYKTTDGRYSAKTLDELINKIKNDGEETEYFSDTDINKLKSLFEQDDDDEDSDEPEDKY